YQEELASLVPNKLASLRPEKYKKVSAAGLVVELRNKTTKSGSRMGFMALDDKSARLEVVMRPAVYEAIKDNIKVDMVVMVHGEVSEDTFNGGIKLDAEQVVSLAEARVEKARAIKLIVNTKERQLHSQKVSELQVLLSAYQTERGLPLVVDYTNDIATVQMKTHAEKQFFPDDDLIEALNAQGWNPQVVV
ncbi:MAG: OB-fold nucleic acid binding domain-containing protein, partial [Thiomicrorhabdus sp.]|nr:OB-fold nucleic acid binding domain-containing protein [Thiomicrorhabdus sp.]